eukprot:UN10745
MTMQMCTEEFQRRIYAMRPYRFIIFQMFCFFIFLFSSHASMASLSFRFLTRFDKFRQLFFQDLIVWIYCPFWNISLDIFEE